jgi:general secretion pathway protein D
MNNLPHPSRSDSRGRTNAFSSLRGKTLVLCLALLIGNGPARAADADLVTLNFDNVDIEGAVRAVSEITGKNFVLDPRVKGTINIVSAKPVSRALVYDVLLAALRVQGFAAIEDRGIVKIVPESEAKLHPSPTSGPQDRTRAGGDRMQTQVFTLRHESAAQLVPILRPLIAPNNPVTAYPASNSLVVTDYAGNLQRIAKIIDAIDQPSGSDPIVSLVAMLDAPTSAAGNIHVVYLKNADAVKLAETLRAIYLGQGSTASRAAATLATPALISQPAGNAAGGGAGSPPALLAAPSSASQVVPAGIIQADAATNSIIINAPDAIYNTLRAALDKLDARRAQVYVEALIAEVTAGKAAEFGIQWQDLSGLGRNSSQAFGGTNFGAAGQNIIGISQNPSSASRGLNLGIVKGQVTIPGIGPVLNLGVLVRALESDANANILSTPTLLTLDNEEAAIVVGQNVPFITGQYALSGAATTPTPFQTVERRDVGLTLRVKPQISEGGTVRLQIYQEVSSVQDTSNAAGVITNKRAVVSTVLVDDGQIVVLGGLIQDTVTDGEQKVPVLGDIPLLGEMFRYRTRGQTKTNLMIFLRPTVVRDAARADAYTGSRYDYIIGEQGRIAPAPSAVLPDIEAPVLPDIEAPVLPPQQ